MIAISLCNLMQLCTLKEDVCYSHLVLLPPAREAIVLLQNSKGVLPLDLSSYKSVAIIGPCANDPVCARGT